ncbi:hypothetical protein BX070DRAFT_226226 [Coemansia spiralis]|nr:hypothetical protein BX070DRAFT_226226 [Coemansia spiralis]
MELAGFSLSSFCIHLYIFYFLLSHYKQRVVVVVALAVLFCAIANSNIIKFLFIYLSVLPRIPLCCHKTRSNITKIAPAWPASAMPPQTHSSTAPALVGQSVCMTDKGRRY